MYNRIVTDIKPLGFHWTTKDPFIFCVHHNDDYPKGNGSFGPQSSLQGRNIGQDFTLKDGWRMYHGKKIPGFPTHPHRGFETVTIVLNGFVDHSDSHGAAGRYGMGDVQWMTAGSGLQHSEMFPLLDSDNGNPLELFQIWLNLPPAKKFSPPHFKMLWAEDIPVAAIKDDNDKTTEVRVIAGGLQNLNAPRPAPDSWAADSDNEVNIWLIRIDPGGEFTIPSASPGVDRSLYFYKGDKIAVSGITVNSYHFVDLLAEEPVLIENSNEEAYILLLQAKPIGEPVVQHGPFVMNSMKEIREAFADYQETQFGGWPWPDYENVHSPKMGRFARYSDGREEVR